MRNRRMVGITALIALLLAIFVMQWSYNGSYDSLADARKACPSVWAVRRDSPFFDVYKPNLSDADTVRTLQENKDQAYTFSCSQQAADKVVQFERTLQISFYIVFIPIWLPLALVTLVVWWIYGEAKNMQKPKKKR